jgi:hypothetical protein
MPKKITKAQRIHFDRLKSGSFNRFNGELVVASLKENKLLWDSFVFGRTGRYGIGELIELRDLSSNFINADEILIITDKKRWSKLYPVIQQWHPKEIGYTSGDDQVWGTPAYQTGKEIGDAMGCSPMPPDLLLVRIWWD